MIFPEEIFTQEILLSIRSYLVRFPEVYFNTDDVYTSTDSIESYLDRENEKSWRYFLSTYQSFHWKEMKYRTAVWTLNTRYSLEFIRNPDFPIKLSSFISDFKSQLFLNRFQLMNHTSIPFFKQTIVDAQSKKITVFEEINAIDFHLEAPLVEEAIFHGNIEVVRFAKCEKLTKIETNCSPRVISMQLTNPKVLEQLSLQNLQELNLVVGADALPIIQFTDQNFPSLLKLILSTKVNQEFIIPSLQLSKLKELTIINKIRIDDFDNCSQLESLRFVKCIAKVSDKITKQIKKLIVDCAELQISWQLLSNIQLLSIKGYDFLDTSIMNLNIPELILNSIHELDSLVIGNRVKKLKLVGCECLPIVELANENHFFEKVILIRMNLDDYSIFKNTNKLFLESCEIDNISEFQNIPYLHIMDCFGIKNFHGIGSKQKYLTLRSCFRLTNDELPAFSTIPFLNISKCPKISNIDCLIHNEIILVEKCLELKQVNLIGENYRLLLFNECKNLKSFDLPRMREKKKKLFALHSDKSGLTELDLKEFVYQ